LVRYNSELRGMTVWHRTHIATLVRQGKPVARAWVYVDRDGDYLVFVEESSDYGPYWLTANGMRPASCLGNQLGWVGGRYVLTPVYVRGRRDCVQMDGSKVPETTWAARQNSIDFRSMPAGWPPEAVGDWSVRW
jgi:hypothetical protein